MDVKLSPVIGLRTTDLTSMIVAVTCLAALFFPISAIVIGAACIEPVPFSAVDFRFVDISAFAGASDLTRLGGDDFKGFAANWTKLDQLMCFGLTRTTSRIANCLAFCRTEVASITFKLASLASVFPTANFTGKMYSVSFAAILVVTFATTEVVFSKVARFTFESFAAVFAGDYLSIVGGVMFAVAFAATKVVWLKLAIVSPELSAAPVTSNERTVLFPFPLSTAFLATEVVVSKVYLALDALERFTAVVATYGRHLTSSSCRPGFRSGAAQPGGPRWVSV